MLEMSVNRSTNDTAQNCLVGAWRSGDWNGIIQKILISNRGASCYTTCRFASASRRLTRKFFFFFFSWSVAGFCSGLESLSFHLSRCTDIEVREKVVTEVTGCFADFSSTRVSIY